MDPLIAENAVIVISLIRSSKRCFWFFRPMGYNWPTQITEKPVPRRFVGNVAHFDDGSTVQVDAVILCTGFYQILFGQRL